MPNFSDLAKKFPKHEGKNLYIDGKTLCVLQVAYRAGPEWVGREWGQGRDRGLGGPGGVEGAEDMRIHT